MVKAVVPGAVPAGARYAALLRISTGRGLWPWNEFATSHSASAAGGTRVRLHPTLQEKTEILILNAGSLVIPFSQLEKEYERLNPDVDLRFEGHGSIQVIRHVTEIGDLADLAVVADYSLLPILMYRAPLPDGTGTYADWNIQFATNRLGIAFTDKSGYAGEINDGNWHEIMSRPDVNLGLADHAP